MKHFLLIVSLIWCCSWNVIAQQWVNPHFDTHRMDCRDLGYPSQNLIEADNGLISALLAHSNGFIYGATSGKTQSYLFFYNRYINKVRPLGKIGNDNGVRLGFRRPVLIPDVGQAQHQSQTGEGRSPNKDFPGFRRHG